MKNQKFHCMIIAIAISILSLSAYAEGPHYYADLVTNIYHVKWDCQDIQGKDQSSLREFTYTQLSESPFLTMEQCKQCFSLVSTDRIPSGTRSFHYLSPYDGFFVVIDAHIGEILRTIKRDVNTTMWKIV